MVAELIALYNDIDTAKLRIARPSKFVFLCGGTIKKDNGKGADSLRDYLYRVRSLRRRLQGEIVLAETANQLYRDTKYSDLITFEEDIARISAVVLVIAESPGSLAELGAFASNDVIRKALRIIIQQAHWGRESFIRFGPVQRIHNDNAAYVGVYPWRVNKTGAIVLRSIRAHCYEIIKFLNRHLSAAPKTEQFPASRDVRIFYIIYWIIYLSLAISPLLLYQIVQILIPDATDKEVRNKVFCMQLAGWIGLERYSERDYFYCLHDKDPFLYAFNIGMTERDTARRKMAVSAALIKAENPPRHVKAVASSRRMPA
ncbi:MAG: retron St85 family effector protein [Geminicoccaceae bacterium]